MKFLIVGAGFSGAVLARQLVDNLDCHVLILEERDHIAGNCHTKRDDSTGIMLHQYGPHIFNTSRKDVWDYVNQYAEFGPYVNRVKAVTHKGIYSLPLNLLTINQFFGKRFSPDEAKTFVASLGDDSIGEPQNFEEQALKFIGRDLYDAFFYGYTKKQWGCEPTELPASVLKRLPVRFNYDDNYYSTNYQGIPLDGYTAIVEQILDHQKIEVKTSCRYESGVEAEYDHLFYSGPIDAFFDHQLGRLGYRTVTFERLDVTHGDYQGNALINYCEEKVAHTRSREDKWFTPWEKHEATVCYREYSQETGSDDLPYYPKRLAKDKDTLQQYVKLAEEQKGVSFLGRLATYRYLNMDQVIGEAIDFSHRWMKAWANKQVSPLFSVKP
ncbi:MAG: UDP-galactopyranose mutase [Verrucomicrobiota bacterium]